MAISSFRIKLNLLV
uniref:Uncharacterized protein n=1 Tax=Rhizophora mucronata TaxID=61149 RepID=A0A2P2P1Q5_RHIMU